MWASFNKERILALGWKLLAPLLIVYGTLTVLDLTGILSAVPREITFQQILYNGQLVFNVYMFKAVVLCFSLLMIFYMLRSREMPLLEVLGHYSFGVFFVHYVLISISRKALEVMGVTINFSIITYLIYFTFVLMTSIVIVYLIKRLSGRYSRYLIGS
jgi:peptidoglycan/LPS O-acetylase OafA/YrhL